MKDVASVIESLETQRAAIDRAIAALREVSAPAPVVKKAGRPRGAVRHAPVAPKPVKKARRRLSAEGRQAIVEALKKRWAEKKAAQAKKK